MRKLILSIVLISCLQFACTNRVTQEELIAEAVELKLAQWRETQRNTCRDRAMLKAETYVDSFLLVNSLNTRLDTIPKPAKPIKPMKPNFKEIPDSLRVDTVFKK